MLDGRYLYAIRIYTPGDSFNLCPADVCQRVDGAELDGSACALDAPKNGLHVEGYTPPVDVVHAVERIMAAAGIELGGVEYMIDARDGRLYYYDVNALSNFVADAPRVVGFDPFARLADWLEAELALVGDAPARPSDAIRLLASRLRRLASKRRRRSDGDDVGVREPARAPRSRSDSTSRWMPSSI